MKVEFNNLKKGERVKTNYSGMATVIETGCYSGKMVKLKCDVPKWCCPYFYESELDLTFPDDGQYNDGVGQNGQQYKVGGEQ